MRLFLRRGPNRRHLLAVTIAAGLAATAAPAFATEDHQPVKVVASFSILGDMVHEIAGDAVDLTVLVGPDGDAHVYEPTPADAKALGEADLLIVNGLDFEAFMPRLVEASGFKGTTIIASTGVAPRAWEDGHEAEGHAAEPAADDAHDHDAHDHDAHADDAHGEGEQHADHDGHAHGAFDPHAWQDLANGEAYVRTIVAGLSKRDPEHAATYEKNGAAYAARLAALDTTLKATFAAIPAERRKVVTSHDAFGYFGRAYGIEFIAPQGLSTEAEASAGDVARIIEQIRDQHITAVFVENITDPRLVDQIARETGAKVGAALYSDALSKADGPAPTYVKMFESNAGALAAAMSGS